MIRKQQAKRENTLTQRTREKRSRRKKNEEVEIEENEQRERERVRKKEKSHCLSIVYFHWFLLYGFIYCNTSEARR